MALLLREGRIESLFIQDTVGKRGKQREREKEPGRRRWCRNPYRLGASVAAAACL